MTRRSDTRCDTAAASTTPPRFFCPRYPASRSAVTVVGQVISGVSEADVRLGWVPAAGLAVELFDVHAASVRHPAIVTATAARTRFIILRRTRAPDGCSGRGVTPDPCSGVVAIEGRGTAPIGDPST